MKKRAEEVGLTLSASEIFSATLGLTDDQRANLGNARQFRIDYRNLAQVARASKISLE